MARFGSLADGKPDIVQFDVGRAAVAADVKDKEFHRSPSAACSQRMLLTQLLNLPTALQARQKLINCNSSLTFVIFEALHIAELKLVALRVVSTFESL